MASTGSGGVSDNSFWEANRNLRRHDVHCIDGRHHEALEQACEVVLILGQEVGASGGLTDLLKDKEARSKADRVYLDALLP